MKDIRIKSTDLNLLVVAASLFKYLNVSRAAEDLGLSQSAVSHALARLRVQLEDPLFVRTTKGIAPTAYARSIQGGLEETLQSLELLLSQKKKFDPLRAEGRVTLATTDYFQIVVLPKLLMELAEEAPRVQISVRPTLGELPKRSLEQGDIDLAVAGFYKDLPEGFYQTKLFTDSFLCAAGLRSPFSAQKKLSTQDYFSARHALITLQGDFRDKARTINGVKKQREIVFGSFSFTSMAWILEESELLLTAPARLIHEYQRFFSLNVWPCPIEQEGLDVRMVWHAQTHRDPLKVWMREKIKMKGLELQGKRKGV